MKKLTINIGMGSLCPFFTNILPRLPVVFPLILFCFPAFSQSALISITGSVHAETGKPLPGATIMIQRTGLRAHANDQGYFNLATPDTAGILTISFIGLQSRQIKFSLKNHGHFEIFLTPITTNISEVSVSTGYQKIPKDRLTGSFYQIDSAIINRRVSPDIVSRLEGVVPGLLFNRNTSSSISGAPDISIRGRSTLFSNDQPLIVIDNFPYDGDLNNINPNDVASISILKDAAAASIWGVRSGNGVIVITTKQGKLNQKLIIDFSANFTKGNKSNVFDDPNFIKSTDLIDIESNLFKKGYFDSKLSSGVQVVSPVVQTLADQRTGSISADAANNLINGWRNIDVRDDIEKYFYRRPSDQQYNLNLRGGSEKTTYYVSFGYDKNISTLVGNQSERLTLNNNFTFRPFKNLEISAGLFYTKDQGLNNSTKSAIYSVSGAGNIYPYAQLADNNGTPLAIAHNLPLSFVNSSSLSNYLNWQYKPLDELRNADNSNSGADNRITTALKYKFLKNFNVEIRYAYEFVSSYTDDYYSLQSYYARNLINEYTQKSASGTLSYPVPLDGIDQLSNARLTANHIRGQLNFDKYWIKNAITAIAGTEWSSTENESNYFSPVYGYNKDVRSNFPTIDYQTVYNYFPRGTGSGQVPNGQSFSRTTDHFISYFANASYTYDERYSVSASARIDESNLFGVNTNQKAVPLFSSGLTWNIAKEKFYQSALVPKLKLRATYGYNGNINKSATAVTTLLQQSNNYYTGGPFNSIANPGNPDLGWEKDRMINFGLDFSFSKEIITGSVEVFSKKGQKLFGYAPLPPTSGQTQFFGNTANTSGHGIDLSIDVKIINQVNFRWNSTLLYTYVLDKVTAYGVAPSIYDYIASGPSAITPIAGAPTFAVYSFRSGPLTHDTGDPQGYLAGKLSTDYANIIRQTQTSDLILAGSSRPTSFGSLRNTWSYNQLSLSVNIIYKMGYYFRKPSVNYGSIYNSWSGNKDFYSRWQNPGDELHTSIPSVAPVPVNSDRDFLYSYSQALVDKGDHIRIQDINIAYDLSYLMKNHGPFSSLQIFGYVNNVGILWRANHDGLDPDIYYSPTGVQNALPLPRTYSIGLKSTLK